MPDLSPNSKYLTPLHWRAFEMTVEDCRAFKARKIYHFTGRGDKPLTAMQWAEIGIDLRLWIKSTRFAMILEIFGFGAPEDLEKMRNYLEGLMDGKRKLRGAGAEDRSFKFLEGKRRRKAGA